ncbi:traY domain protein [Escherichia coli]|nr:traY domain protein [Escherichia coli]
MISHARYKLTPEEMEAFNSAVDHRLAELTIGFAPIFPDICYHLTHYKPAAADIPVASDNPAHYADAIRYNARTPLQGSLLPLTRLVWA